MNNDFKYNIQKTFDLLSLIFEESKIILSKIFIDSQSKQKIVVACLYCRILELTHSATTIINSKVDSDKIALPIILRSIFEVFTDLKNLINDKNYINSLEIKHLKDKEKLSKQVKNNNPYTSGITRILNIEAEIQSIKSRLKLLTDQGYKAFNIFEKFDLADLELEYRVVYNLLCQETHSGIGALTNRYISKVNEKINIVIFNNITIKEQLPYFISVIGLNVGANNITSNFFDIEVSLDNTTKQFEEIKLFFEKELK